MGRVMRPAKAKKPPKQLTSADVLRVTTEKRT